LGNEKVGKAYWRRPQCYRWSSGSARRQESRAVRFRKVSSSQEYWWLVQPSKWWRTGIRTGPHVRRLLYLL